MGEPALSDEAELTRRAQQRLSEVSYAGKRRRAGEENFDARRAIKKWAGIAASLPAIGLVIFTIANVWFQSDAEAQTAHAAIIETQEVQTLEIARERKRIDAHESLIGAINGKLDRQEILALKAERRGLRTEIEAAEKLPAVRRRLEKQLEAVDEDLRLKGVTP